MPIHEINSYILNNFNHKALNLISENSKITQRELAESLGISLGSANYCIQALISKGLIKIKNFSKNKNKKSYYYLLTPSAIKQKANLTLEFLKIKKIEFENLRQEIKLLEDSVEKISQSENSISSNRVS